MQSESLPSNPQSMYSAWILAGATATGKSSAAQILAERTGASILSSDAMLVYRGMDIGTAKPSAEERGSVPYFGIDLANPDEPFSTGKWLDAAKPAIAQTAESPLIIAGGTGLYMKAITEGLEGAEVSPECREYWREFLDKEGADKLREVLRKKWPEEFVKIDDPQNPRRLTRAAELLETSGKLPDHWGNSDANHPRPIIPVLSIPREALHKRIADRIEIMFQRGLAEEVEALRKKFPVWSATAQKAIGYAEVCDWQDGKITLEEAKEKIRIRTRQLAKRQETWFHHQAEIVQIPTDPQSSAKDIADRVWEVWRKYGPTRLV